MVIFHSYVSLPEGKSIAESPDFDQISGPILWPGNGPEGPMIENQHPPEGCRHDR